MGPTTLLRGDTNRANVTAAAALTLTYGKGRNEPAARVTVRPAGTDTVSEVTVAPAEDAAVNRWMIKRKQNA